MPVSRFVAPGPLVASATPGTPVIAPAAPGGEGRRLLVVHAHDPRLAEPVERVEQVRDHAARHLEDGRHAPARRGTTRRSRRPGPARSSRVLPFPFDCCPETVGQRDLAAPSPSARAGGVGSLRTELPAAPALAEADRQRRVDEVAHLLDQRAHRPRVHGREVEDALRPPRSDDDRADRLGDVLDVQVVPLLRAGARRPVVSPRAGPGSPTAAGARDRPSARTPRSAAATTQRMP